MNKRCKICGTEFEDGTCNQNKVYCSKDCRHLARRPQQRGYKRKKRKLERATFGISESERNIRANGTSLLGSLKIVIDEKGQERIEGALVLERMGKRK